MAVFAKCPHGMDARFCSLCNKPSFARSAGQVTLPRILAFLNREHVRATYGAVAELLGVNPRGMGSLLGARRAEASWVVNRETGLPTDYDPSQCHPALLSKPDIITSGRGRAGRKVIHSPLGK